MEIEGVKYSFTVGSDVNRDGMFLEATVAGDNAKAVAEIFYSDASKKFTLSCFEESVPIELVEYLLAEAKARLPSIEDQGDG